MKYLDKNGVGLDQWNEATRSIVSECISSNGLGGMEGHGVGSHDCVVVDAPLETSFVDASIGCGRRELRIPDRQELLCLVLLVSEEADPVRGVHHILRDCPRENEL